MLTEDYVVEALEAERKGDRFSIGFEIVWKNAGYARKDNAKKALKNELIENEDYVIETAWDLLQNPSTKLTSSAFLRDLLTTGLLDKNGENLTPKEKAVLMTVEVIRFSPDGFDHFCMMARTAEGREARKRFIQYKKAYLAQLERQFQSQLETEKELAIAHTTALESEIAALKSQVKEAIENHLEFAFSLDHLHQVSGIVSKYQVKSAIKRDFLEGRDYVLVESNIFVNESTFNILILSFRSLCGTDISALPETIRIATRVYFQYQEVKRKNKCVAQKESPDQMCLFD